MDYVRFLRHLGGEVWRQSFGARESLDQERFPVGEAVQDG